MTAWSPTTPVVAEVTRLERVTLHVAKISGSAATVAAIDNPPTISEMPNALIRFSVAPTGEKGTHRQRGHAARGKRDLLPGILDALALLAPAEQRLREEHGVRTESVLRKLGDAVDWGHETTLLLD